MASAHQPAGDALFLPPPTQSAAAASTTLCCLCGVAMPPNAANMCAPCLRARVDVTEGAPRHAAVVHCPSCSSYLEPPRRWTRAAPESAELLQLLLRRVQRPLQRLGVSLSAAEFVFTEPHSKRLMLRLRLRREVLPGCGVALERDHAVEFTVHDRLCDSCSRARADPEQDQWCAVVQLRQRAAHRRTLLHLEHRLAALGAAGSATRVDVTGAGGIDFFFASRSQAASLVALIASLAPARVADAARQLVSHDTKSNTYRHRHAFSVELCPVCRDDLVFHPGEASRALGGLGPLVLCVRVTDTLALLDASTHRIVNLGMKEYDRHRLEPVLTSRQLVEYVVLDVDTSPATTAARFGYRTAYAQVVRASELGRSDAMVTVRTHLGHILGPGDRALGYDLRGANTLGVDSHCLPDAVLVKKMYEKKMHQGGSGSDKMQQDEIGIDEIAMGIGGIDLDPCDEVELDELLEDLRI
ncbi:60S ribosomal export protein NMD3-like [Hordeum vulgare subsp. vulgare]|uniref:60S ribosomal export protein NMD3-like n=1 Tax=Hordeum vulgare subsp. vulgare TaxID=112509 RepID=UPI001B85AD32|nr:60S ribosomal export protein NMD3-like [Hordeum vulgare subsp. vulgare]